MEDDSEKDDLGSPSRNPLLPEIRCWATQALTLT